jgi:hypothetical protein
MVVATVATPLKFLAGERVMDEPLSGSRVSLSSYGLERGMREDTTGDATTATIAPVPRVGLVVLALRLETKDLSPAAPVVR